MKNVIWGTLAMSLALVFASWDNAHAMHISEGILPAKWAAIWFVAAIPFVYLGIVELRRRSTEGPQFKALVGLVGAAVFIISCMPIPVPFAGTCSHPCGTGLAAIIVGPAVTALISSIALILQALFLAHGGLTTLGADIFSMGVVGAYVGYGAYYVMRKMGAGFFLAAFMGGVLSDWATYAVTSLELSTALHGSGDMMKMFFAIAIAFIPTQIPLGIFEGIISGVALRFLENRRPEFVQAVVAR